MKKEGFWASDPCALIYSPWIPSRDLSRDEKLNNLTRLVILIFLGLLLMNNMYAMYFLLLALLLIVVVGCAVKSMPNREGFTLTPTSQDLSFMQTTVAPSFSEEWQVIPPAYDLSTNAGCDDTFTEILTPQDYPYSQYLTRTNLLPGDESQTHLMCGGSAGAREYANSTFLRHDLAFRDNMTRIYKKSLARRFRHTSNDSFSPYSSF